MTLLRLFRHLPRCVAVMSTVHYRKSDEIAIFRYALIYEGVRSSENFIQYNTILFYNSIYRLQYYRGRIYTRMSVAVLRFKKAYARKIRENRTTFAECRVTQLFFPYFIPFVNDAMQKMGVKKARTRERERG